MPKGKGYSKGYKRGSMTTKRGKRKTRKSKMNV